MKAIPAFDDDVTIPVGKIHQILYRVNFYRPSFIGFILIFQAEFFHDGLFTWFIYMVGGPVNDKIHVFGICRFSVL